MTTNGKYFKIFHGGVETAGTMQIGLQQGSAK